MPISMLIVYTVVAVTFSWILVHIGRTMMGTKSMRASIERFEKNPKQASFIEKYFYGWAFPWQLAIMKRLSQGSGDAMMTSWLKICGFIFILFAIFFMSGTLVLWYMNLAA